MAVFTAVVLAAAWPAALAAKLVLLAVALAPTLLAVRSRANAGKARSVADEAIERAMLAAAEEVVARAPHGMTAAELATRLKIDESRGDALLTRLAVHDRTRVDVGDDAEVRYSVRGTTLDTAGVRVKGGDDAALMDRDLDQNLDLELADDSARKTRGSR
ncbi:hypothetical protein [Labilithrix luteola]|nr:hypothetical protein [Labilithrix luteola]